MNPINPNRISRTVALSALASLAAAGYLLATRPVNATPQADSIGVLNKALRDKLFDAGPAPQASVADVVAKALAFKALLSTDQQQALEQPYTPTLARRWSNLPCAGTCRNGVRLGSLTPEQLVAALEVIRAAAGSSPNEGADQFAQIRLADTNLANNGGNAGGPGNFSYGEGFYYLAFLNTPSTTGSWMLQFGGHHYAANFAYYQGRPVAATPHFLALEPLSFTANGTSYTPLAREQAGLAAMLASFTPEQLTAARLTQTFGDVTMSPGESNGGNGAFPTARVGIAVSSLSAAQKQLVFDAIRPWVRDAEDTVAANLLAIYQSELDATYVAYTGNGTSGNAASFLNANTNYVRIDGPSVWIEFACQNGIIYRNQIHYHTIWRDRNRDYGKDLSLTVPLDQAVPGTIRIASAASFDTGSLAPDAIGTLFGTSLAANATSAPPNPLPTTLDGVQVQIRDAAGTTRAAQLLYVSPTQISFLVPTGTAAGAATVTVTRNSSTVGQGTLTVEAVTPGLFAANANGSGVAAAVALRVKADGTQVTEPLILLNSTTNQFEAVPISVSDPAEQVYLLAFGTGFRNRSALSAVTVTIGGVAAPLLYAGAQGGFAGLDQANARIPASLAGRGSVDVVLTADGKRSNAVSISVR